MMELAIEYFRRTRKKEWTKWEIVMKLLELQIEELKKDQPTKE